MERFVKISKIYKKLKQAEKEFRPIFIFAPTGFGKTTNVRNYFRHKSFLELSGEGGSLKVKPPAQSIRQGIVVIDDISWISDKESIEYILDLLYHSGKLIVLISRGTIPGWIEGAAADLYMIQAGKNDMLFDESAVQKCFLQNDIHLEEQEIRHILNVTEGYPPFIVLLARRMVDGEKLSEKTFNEVRMDIFCYFDNVVFSAWDEKVRKMLLALCPYERFTVDMVAQLTEESDVGAMLDYCRNIGDFLYNRSERNYYMGLWLQKFLNWKRQFVYTKEEEKANYKRAARYYEEHSDTEKSMEYYHRAGEDNKIRDLLIENTRLHPKNGDYFAMLRYYRLLPKEMICGDSVLISGISMMYSLMAMPDESERWYEELKKLEESETDRERKKEIMIRRAYLDISLPHRGFRNITELRNKALFCRRSSLNLPELSVTYNLPSVMNGGLDLCEWTKGEEQIVGEISELLETMIGKFSKGIVDIALAESRFEKGTSDSVSIISGINRGYMLADMGGRIELCFVGTALLVKQYLVSGNIEDGMTIMGGFKKKVEQIGGDQLKKNIEAFEAWLTLYMGNREMAEEYLLKAPQEQHEFWSVDMFRYMIKIRCLIEVEKYEMALSIIERLAVYFEKYERTYMWIDNQILKSVVLYKMRNRSWEETFEKAYCRAEKFHFVRIISLEAGGVLPLIEKAELDKDTDYYAQVFKETKRMSRTYPNYLKTHHNMKDILTEKELMILQAMCMGESSEEICSEHGFTYSGLKYHCRNIYRKLNVSKRSEAEREAMRHGIVHIGR